jgi:hypothetical protein
VQALTADGSENMGDIVAAFPNSFYIRTSRHELIFVTNRHLKSPITINLEPETNLGQTTKPLETVSLNEHEIRLSQSTSIDLTRATRSHESLVPKDHQLAMTKEFLYLGSLILMIIDNRLSVLDPNGLAHAGVSEFISKGLMPFCQSKDARLFCDAAGKIVGLGGGFTPSGDDLLGGFFAAYNSFARAIGCQKMLLDFEFVESRTSWVSAKLFDYLQRRILDDQVRELIDSAANGNTDGSIAALETLLPRGHTSGIDILVGVILALCLAYDIQSKGSEIGKIAEMLGLSR